MEIQDTVIKYADIISKISGIDVEVVDENLFRVAGTGIFADKINMDMSSEGYVYRQVLKTGKRSIIYDPGKEEICKECPIRNTCKEELEISMPVFDKDKIIGVIGLIGASKEQKDRILSNENLYFDFLDQMADFISTKAAEYTELKRNKLSAESAGTENGVIIISSDNTVTDANDDAKRHINCANPEGMSITVTQTGSSVDGMDEHRLVFNNREYFIMGHKYILQNPTEKYYEVVIFDSIKSSEHNEKNNIVKEYYSKRLFKNVFFWQDEDFPILITGESGTGKAAAALALWENSTRKNEKFNRINCTALSWQETEKELFGELSEHGLVLKKGKLAQSDKGILFIDEIGDMPLNVQTKLIKVIRDGKIIKNGAVYPFNYDVKIIASTNKNLKEEVKNEKIKKELYNYLSENIISLPSLNDSRESISVFAELFMHYYAEIKNKEFVKISEEAYEALLNYKWNCNIRELENVMEYLCDRMEEGMVKKEYLPPQFEMHDRDREKHGENEIYTIKELEKKEIKKALSIYGNSTEAKKLVAKSLGIGIATLYRKIEEYNL